MNSDGSYSSLDLDRPEYALNVPWTGPVHFKTLWSLVLFFVYLAISKLVALCASGC